MIENVIEAGPQIDAGPRIQAGARRDSDSFVLIEARDFYPKFYGNYLTVIINEMLDVRRINS